MLSYDQSCGRVEEKYVHAVGCVQTFLTTTTLITTPHIHCAWSLDLLNALLRYFDWNFFTVSAHRRSCLNVLNERYTVDLSILKGKSEKKRRDNAQFIFFEV